MEEIWKDIKDYEGLYQVSNLGRVKNIKTDRIIKPWKNYGYLIVNLSKKSVVKHHRVHRLIAEAFIPNPDNKPEVDHINTIRDDNRVENLQWATDSDQMNNVITKQAMINALKNNNKTSKNIVQYTISGQFVAEYPSISEAHRQTGILTSYICKNLKGYDKFETAGGYIWKYTSDILGDNRHSVRP